MQVPVVVVCHQRRCRPSFFLLLLVFAVVMSLPRCNPNNRNGCFAQAAAAEAAAAAAVLADEENEEEAEISVTGEAARATTTTQTTTQPSPTKTKTKSAKMIQQAQIQELEGQAFQHPRGSPPFRAMWQHILKLDPGNGNALVQLGIEGVTSSNYAQRQKGIVMLEHAFDPQQATTPIPMPSQPGVALAMLIGRFRWEQKEYDAAYKFINMANTASQAMGTTNICAQVHLATMLHPFPNSTQQADEMMERYMKAAQDFVERYKNRSSPQNNNKKRDKPLLDETQLSATVLGAADDPYVHCVLTVFHLSFYYRANVAAAANLHYQVATTVWPQLAYQSSKLVVPSPANNSNNDNNDKARPLTTTTTLEKTCRTGKIRLGVASGFLTPNTPVSSDFNGILQRLNRNIFDVTYLHFHITDSTNLDPFVRKHKQDKIMTFDKPPHDTQGDGAWVSRHYKAVEDLDLDILLYLDLTMSPFATRMAMARLAPVQANSHGHPMTSGVPAVDYFISWGAAELEDSAQDHYTEKLILLNATVPHQFYIERHDNKTGRSRINGGNFEEIKHRRTFGSVIPEDGHWYTCMQKPHKFMPEMDVLICGVLQQDLEGRVILHEPDTAMLRDSFNQRLKDAGCDMDRVYFLPVQMHHRLLALYAVSDVILDSYPAGGCTTTREALELGSVVVTYPARLLGGRWTYAYYKIMNDTRLTSLVVASSAEDYIQKAVALGRDPKLRAEAESIIRNRLHRMYRRKEAVASWEKALLEISPVEQKSMCVSSA